MKSDTKGIDWKVDGLTTVSAMPVGHARYVEHWARALEIART